MPIRDYICGMCGHQFEEIMSGAPENYDCSHCVEDGHKKTARLLPPLPGGYKMISGGSSTRPKQAGSFKAKKAAQ